MKMTNKQKACVATALAVGVIATQGYMLVEKNNDYKDLEKQLTKQVTITQDITKENNENLKQIDELTKSNSDKENRIKELESEKVRLNSTIEKLKSSAYPTSVSRGITSRTGTPVKMTLTFYGDGAEENGGYAGMNAYSQKLTAGMVASNVYPRGTKFRLDNGQVFTVQDTGGPNFNSYNRLDVFVPRLPGESKYAYDKRISNYGRKTVTMYKID